MHNYPLQCSCTTFGGPVTSCTSWWNATYLEVMIGDFILLELGVGNCNNVGTEQGPQVTSRGEGGNIVD